MANKPIVMSNLRRVLQLYQQGKSKLFISNYLGLSRNTVNKYITQCLLQEKGIEEVLALSDLDLEKLFIEKPPPDPTKKLKELYSFFPYVEKMLKNTGVTKAMHLANEVNCEYIFIRFNTFEQERKVFVESNYYMSYKEELIPFQLIDNAKKLERFSIDALQDIFKDYV